jgi:ATP-dependent helicase HepA
VPADLDALNERFVVGACELLGFDTAEKPGARAWYLEFGGGAVIDQLPGVPGGTRCLGTFDRAEAVAREELDFFAAGHPLVEGLLAEVQDGPRGRSALLELAGSGQAGLGLLLVLPDPQEGEWLVAIDLEGRPRPEWQRLVLERRRELRQVTPDAWEESLPGEVDWRERATRLLARAGGERLRAAAGLRLRP